MATANTGWGWWRRCARRRPGGGPPSQEAGFGLLDGLYSMVISLGGGQGSEPDRWAYSHGYSGYLLDDPTLEINDQGLPFYTVTLLQPRVGWTFGAPVGVLVINAHTGQINRYALSDVPTGWTACTASRWR